MAPLVFVVPMGVHSDDSAKEIKEDLMKIPGVVEVLASLVTGHVAVVGMAGVATLGQQLEARLRKPVYLLADLRAAPPPPSFPFPAPATMVGGGSSPGSAGGGRVLQPVHRLQPAASLPDTTAGALEDDILEDEIKKGCCCSIL